jgi:hypothetical protein
MDRFISGIDGIIRSVYEDYDLERAEELRRISTAPLLALLSPHKSFSMDEVGIKGLHRRTGGRSKVATSHNKMAILLSDVKAVEWDINFMSADYSIIDGEVFDNLLYAYPMRVDLMSGKVKTYYEQVAKNLGSIYGVHSLPTSTIMTLSALGSDYRNNPYIGMLKHYHNKFPNAHENFQGELLPDKCPDMCGQQRMLTLLRSALVHDLFDELEREQKHPSWDLHTSPSLNKLDFTILRDGLMEGISFILRDPMPNTKTLKKLFTASIACFYSFSDTGVYFHHPGSTILRDSPWNGIEQRSISEVVSMNRLDSILNAHKRKLIERDVAELKNMGMPNLSLVCKMITSGSVCYFNSYGMWLIQFLQVAMGYARTDPAESALDLFKNSVKMPPVETLYQDFLKIAATTALDGDWKVPTEAQYLNDMVSSLTSNSAGVLPVTLDINFGGKDTVISTTSKRIAWLTAPLAAIDGMQLPNLNAPQPDLAPVHDVKSGDEVVQMQLPVIGSRQVLGPKPTRAIYVLSITNFSASVMFLRMINAFRYRKRGEFPLKVGAAYASSLADYATGADLTDFRMLMASTGSQTTCPILEARDYSSFDIAQHYEYYLKIFYETIRDTLALRGDTETRGNKMRFRHPLTDWWRVALGPGFVTDMYFKLPKGDGPHSGEAIFVSHWTSGSLFTKFINDLVNWSLSSAIYSSLPLHRMTTVKMAEFLGDDSLLAYDMNYEDVLSQDWEAYLKDLEQYAKDSNMELSSLKTMIGQRSTEYLKVIVAWGGVMKRHTMVFGMTSERQQPRVVFSDIVDSVLDQMAEYVNRGGSMKQMTRMAYGMYCAKAITVTVKEDEYVDHFDAYPRLGFWVTGKNLMYPFLPKAVDWTAMLEGAEGTMRELSMGAGIRKMLKGEFAVSELVTAVLESKGARKLRPGIKIINESLDPVLVQKSLAFEKKAHPGITIPRHFLYHNKMEYLLNRDLRGVNNAKAAAREVRLKTARNLVRTTKVNPSDIYADAKFIASLRPHIHVQQPVQTVPYRNSGYRLCACPDLLHYQSLCGVTTHKARVGGDLRLIRQVAQDTHLSPEDLMGVLNIPALMDDASFEAAMDGLGIGTSSRIALRSIIMANYDLTSLKSLYGTSSLGGDILSSTNWDEMERYVTISGALPPRLKLLVHITLFHLLQRFHMKGPVPYVTINLRPGDVLRLLRTMYKVRTSGLSSQRAAERYVS